MRQNTFQLISNRDVDKDFIMTTTSIEDLFRVSVFKAAKTDRYKYNFFL